VTSSSSASRSPASSAQGRWCGRIPCGCTLAVLVEQAFENPSGRPDLNRRPLTPNARIWCLARSERVGRRASHLHQRPGGVATSPAESEGIGSPDWLPWLPRAGEAFWCRSRSATTSCTWRSMAGSSRPARERIDGWWEASHWPRFFDRHQAITALTVPELLPNGGDRDDPLLRALREQLQ
jgi:hypothetical protein